MTDLDLEAPGKPGTPNYAAAAVYLLTRTADVWAVPGLNGVEAGIFGARITVTDDHAAARIARLLGISDDVTHVEVGDGFIGQIRDGVVGGIRLAVTSVVRITDGEVAA